MTETVLVGAVMLVAAAIFGVFALVGKGRAKRRPPVDATRPPLVQPRTSDVSGGGAHDYLREACLWLRFIGINLILLAVVGALLMIFVD